MSTIREQIISRIVSQAANILTTVGYNISLGTHAYRAVKNFDDSAAVVVFPQVETAEKAYGISQNTMPVKLEGFSTFGSTNPSEIAEQLLGDLIEFMTASTFTMAFTSGGTYVVAVGNTITGHTSTSTAYVVGVAVTSGSWAGGSAAGTLTLRRKKGDFSGENLDVGTSLNVATVTGTVTTQSAITRVTNSLAQDIAYVGGGTEDYPEGAMETVGVYALFNIYYETLAGNPHGQP